MNGIMNLKKYIALSLMVATFGFFTQCAEEFDSPDTISGNTLVDVAATDTTLEILTAALTKTGIGISLDNVNSGQHTVFAPTDSAFRVYFKTLPSGIPGPASNYNTDAGVINYVNSMSTTSALTLATFTLRLQYHVVSSEAMAADITNSTVFTTINGARLSLSKVPGNGIYINANNSSNGARVRKADIDGANGVIHSVSRFMSAISIASVVTTNTTTPAVDMDVLAITVDYTKSPADVTIQGADRNHNLFAAAVKKTGLATTLRPNVATAFLPDFTIFCPTDVAMQAYLFSKNGTVISEATAITFINSLADADPNADPPIVATDPTLTEFTNLIKYHIVTGRVLTTDVTDNQELTTLLSGKTITVVDAAPSVILEDAKTGTGQATISNTKLSNAGILHRIGAVLLPQ